MRERVIEKSEDDEVPLETGLRTGHAIFKCEECNSQRIYGNGVPSRDRYLLYCSGTCYSHTWHEFLRIY